MATSAYQRPSELQSGNFGYRAVINPPARQVERANLSAGIKELILADLTKDPSGRALYQCIERRQRQLAPPRRRAKTGFDSLGRKLGPCIMISFRQVERRIHTAIAMGLYKLIIPAGTWVPGKMGKLEFRRTPTYALCLEELPPPAESEEEYVAARTRKRAQRESHPRRMHHNGHAAPSEIPSAASSPESPTPAQPAASLQPPPAAPVRVESPTLVGMLLDGSRKAERLRKLRIEFRTRIAALVAGHERYLSSEGLIELAPNHPDYRLPLPRDQAIEQAISEIGLTGDEARDLREFVREESP